MGEIVRRMARRSIGSQIKDLLAYAAIGVACVAVIGFLGAHTTKWSEPASARLLNGLGLAGVLTIVFITAIHDHRSAWASLRFWTGWTSALLVEATVGVLALWNAPRLTVWVWGLLYPVNAAAVEIFIGWWLQERSAVRDVRGGPTRG